MAFATRLLYIMGKGKATSIGIQTSLIDTGMINGYITDVMDKCVQMHTAYQAGIVSLANGRKRLDEFEKAVMDIGSEFLLLENHVQTIGTRLLDNDQEIDKKRANIEVLQAVIAIHKKKVDEEHRKSDREKQQKKNELRKQKAASRKLQVLRVERDILDGRIYSIKRGIDKASDDAQNSEDRLKGLRSMRTSLRSEHLDNVRRLQTMAEASDQLQQRMLAISPQDDATVDLSDIYKGAGDVIRVKEEIAALQHQQVSRSGHLEALKETRQFAKERNDLLAANIVKLGEKQKAAEWPASVLRLDDDHVIAPSELIQSMHVTAPDLKKMVEAKYGKFGTGPGSQSDSSLSGDSASDGASISSSSSDYTL